MEEGRESTKNEIRQWGDAWILSYRSAMAGRMFRGILHNLNGVVQAFSLQTELLGMTFANAITLLEDLDPSLSPTQQSTVAKVLELLRKRQLVLPQMLEQVQVAKEIACLAQPLREGVAMPLEQVTYADIVRQEVEFLTADGFFKHNVKKIVELADGDRMVVMTVNDFRFVVDVLLQNAIDAVAGMQQPLIAVRGRVQDDMLYCTVEDNGEGISAEKKLKLFQPFFTTRAARAGLGLHLARRKVAEVGGYLVCGPAGPRTVFTLTIPCSAIGGGRS